MIIDSHCHLDYEPINSSLDEVIERAKKNGVTNMLTISTEDKKYSKILEIVNKYKNVYGTYGIHPHEANVHQKINSKTIIEKIKMNNKIIGIGETGLDFYYNHSEKDIQIKLFLEHIKASRELNLPLIVHTRAAENETYNILKKENKNRDLKILIHCFTGSVDFAKKILDLNCYISASGIVTFKKSSELRKAFEIVPLERLLVETDSPYLSPEPLRGKSNEPGNIIHTIKFLSNLKKIDYESIISQTSKNFLNLFGKLN